MREKTDAEPSYSNGGLDAIGIGDDFRNKLVKAQWKYTKERLKKNETPRSLVETGDLYLLRQNYKRAADYYQRSLILDPEYLPALEKIIRAYSEHNKHDEAEIYFKQLLKLTNNRSDIYRNYATFKVDALFKKGGDIEEVLSYINRALEKNSSDIELINIYGFILLNFKNDVEGAKKYFEKALSIQNNFFHALNNLGVCFVRQDKLDDAINKFSLCIEVAPLNYPSCYENLTYVFIREMKYQEAYSILTRAISTGVPIGPGARHLVGWLLMRINEFEKARVWHTSKLKEEPQNQLLYNNLGYCYLVLGNNEEAEMCFIKAVSITEKKIERTGLFDIRSLRAFYNLGRISMTNGRIKQIRLTSQRIFELNPEDAFAYYLQGAALNMEENYSEAKKSFEKALELDVHIEEVYPDYSFILGSIDGNYKEAKSLLEKAISLGFSSVLVRNNLAHSYICLEMFKEAEEILNKYNVGHMPPVILATRGLMALRTDHLEEGTKLYEQAINEFEQPRNKRIAMQIKNIELARFYIKKGDKEMAKRYLSEAKAFPPSYLNKEIETLEIGTR